MQLSFASADLVLKYVRSLLAPGQPSGSFVADAGQVRELVLLVAGVLEGTDHSPPRGTAHLLEEGVQVISDMLLVRRPLLCGTPSPPLPSMVPVQSLLLLKPQVWWVPEGTGRGVLSGSVTFGGFHLLESMGASR